MKANKPSPEELNESLKKISALMPLTKTRRMGKGQKKQEELFGLMKRSLTIIEAVYFQSREMFTPVRAEEYSKIITELTALGYAYQGNQDIMDKAATAAILHAKLPMEKAKGANRRAGTSIDQTKKAG
ncbi:MAG: hypothetical protein OEY56_08450 [Cyclobacteriaceae bacterium]|nr:hypothetical protein [Cyclobacteriaceae bacterium]